MSFTPAIPLHKPLKFQEGLRQAKVRLAAADLLDAGTEVMDLLSPEELAKLLEPPLDRIVVNRRIRRFLPVLAVHPSVKHSSREKALELALRRRRTLPAGTFLSLYEEYYDKPSVKGYLRERYPDSQQFGRFTKEQFSVEKPAEYLHRLIFDARNSRLNEYVETSGLKADSRLAREILSIQLSQPSLAWLEGLTKPEVDTLFELCDGVRERFKYFELWLKVLCGGTLPRTRSELVNNKKARRLVNWATARHRLGDPFEASLRWRQASPELLRLVQLYLFEKVIDDFFSSDNNGDRFQFWRNFAEQCSGMQRFPRDNAFAMKIGHLWFVEFVPTGACYIYSESNFAKVANGLDLKSRSLCVSNSITVQGSTGPAVLTPPLSHVHRGAGRSYTWQKQFSEFIRKHAL